MLLKWFPVKQEFDNRESKMKGLEPENYFWNKSCDTGIFGVLYTVSKEKSPTWSFVAFRSFIDWIQMFLWVIKYAFCVFSFDAQVVKSKTRLMFELQNCTLCPRKFW